MSPNTTFTPTPAPEPRPVTVARETLAEFDQGGSDRVHWDRVTYAEMAHRLAEALRATLYAYDDATTGGQQ